MILLWSSEGGRRWSGSGLPRPSRGASLGVTFCFASLPHCPNTYLILTLSFTFLPSLTLGREEGRRKEEKEGRGAEKEEEGVGVFLLPFSSFPHPSLTLGKRKEGGRREGKEEKEGVGPFLLPFASFPLP